MQHRGRSGQSGGNAGLDLAVAFTTDEGNATWIEKTPILGVGEAGEAISLPSPKEPMTVARELARLKYKHDTGALTLRYWRGGWWEWRTTHWVECDPKAIAREAYRFTESATYPVNDKDRPWDPNRSKIADLVDCLAVVCELPEDVVQPSWIDGNGPSPIVACQNGLLDVGKRTLYVHTPRYFNQVAVAFDYEVDAGDPVEWLGFLEALWGEDDAVAALQEFVGYVLSGRLDLDTILLLVGPPRSGKGVICRVMEALVGKGNVCGPSLFSLASEFGLQPLLGKALAFVSEARASNRDTSMVVEKLLTISGRDTVTVNRKYRDPVSGQLPTRFVVVSNELPRLGDASRAIVSRLLVLQMMQSWLRNEDRELEERLHKELPAIFCWALDGLQRLDEQGRFTIPESMDEAVVTLHDLASPKAAFVRDRADLAPYADTSSDDLYGSWKGWAEENGHAAGSKATFIRDLCAAFPSLKKVRPRFEGEKRQPAYRGIALRKDPYGP